MRRAVVLALLVIGSANVALGQESGPQRGEPRPARSSEPTKTGEMIDVEVVLVEWNQAVNPAESLSGSGKAVAERIAALEKAGKLTVNKRFRMTAYENLQSMIQLGERRARVTSMQVAAGGRTMNQVQFENVGMLLSVQPTIIDEKIAMQINFEQSAPKKRDDAPVIGENADGEKVRSESMGTLTVQTTVSLKSGDTVVVGGVSEGATQQILLVTARVVK